MTRLKLVPIFFKCVSYEKMSNVVLLCCFYFVINLILNPQSANVLGARSTDELDGGYVVREETSHVIYHHNHYDNYSSHNYPIQVRNAFTPEDIKFWGCYSVWDGEQIPPGAFYDSIHEVDTHPFVCMRDCQNQIQGYTIAFIKGILCTCTTWDVFKKIRLEADSYCNFNCKESNNNGMSVIPNATCGGNLAFSVYCLKTDPKCAQSNNDPIGAIHTVDSLPNASTQANDHFNNPIDAYPLEECAECGSTECFAGGVVTPVQDYFPLNSPEACIQNCRRGFRNGTIKPSAIAILGFLPLTMPSVHTIPICMCYAHNPFNITDTAPYMTPVHKSNCPTQCPGDDSSMCGNYQSFKHFIVYCAISGTGVCHSPAYDESPESTVPTESSTSPETTTVETTSVESTNSSTSTTSSSTTTTTTTSTSSSTSTVLTTTYRVPVETTTLPSSILRCDAWDIYHVHWTGVAGELVTKNCNDTKYFQDKNGVAKWQCLNNGSFEYSLPDYTDCKTDWHQDMWSKFNENIEQSGSLPMNMSKNMLSVMEENSRTTDKNKIPYYGHEIMEISNLTWSIINYTNATLSEREALLRQAIDLPALLLSNPAPWQDLRLPNRIETATGLLLKMEQTLFCLTENVNSSTHSNYNFTIHSEHFNSDQFLTTFGVRSKSSTSSLTFPLEATAKSSFIRISEGWQQGVPEPIFVGKSIDPAYIEKLLPVTEIRLPRGKVTNEAIINGQLLSLSILNVQETATTKVHYLKGKTVTITFQHKVEAWGKNGVNIARKLHPGEKPKAVLASAICVFWDEYNKLWGTDGCKVIQTTATYTICECTHLTSFAILMDVHNYIGKDRALEVLTLLLCPLSTICLFISIIVFSTVGSIQNQRTTITKHLCICLMIGNVLLLFVVDKNYFMLPQEVCIGVGIVTHYVFLAAFVWMAIEGTHLYKMVVHVFDSGRTNTTIYRIIAYGIPLLIVGLTCVIGYLLGDDPYGGELYCWLEGLYIWGFVIPMTLVLMGNLIILFVALKTAYQMRASTAVLQARQRSYKTWIRGSFSITVILGVTWLPGFFVTTGSSATIATVAGYIFVLLNASQGIFLFIFHCLMNDKVRSVVERNLSLPSWLSLQGTSSSKEFTQSGKRSENMSKQNGRDTMRGYPNNRKSSSNSSKPSGDFSVDYPAPQMKKLDSADSPLSTSSQKSLIPSREGERW